MNGLSERNRVAVGIDIGGTKTLCAAYDEQLNELAHVRTQTTVGSAELVGGSILATIEMLRDQLGDARIRTVGVGIPGLVDQRSGTVRQAVNLGIEDDPLPIVELITTATGAPCRVDNDVNVAALGVFEILRNPNALTDLAYLSIGTGVAAGVVLGAALHRGRLGVAGEIGHLPVTGRGPECECGLRGCLEVMTAGPAIARYVEASAYASGLQHGTATDRLLAAERAGDPDARAAVTTIADHLAHAVYTLAIMYDVEMIVIGGGVADVGEPLIEVIRSGISRLEARSGFVRSLYLGDRVCLKPIGEVGAFGAAALAMIGNETP